MSKQEIQSRESNPLFDRAEHSERSPFSVHQLVVSYNQKPVLWNVDYDAPEGELIAIVGPNGAGKSSFLKAILDIIPRASGRVAFWGKDLRTVRGRVAYVPQRESVDWEFPISALEVVLMGMYSELRLFQQPKAEHRARAEYALEQVGMQDFATRQISQLSGGQQQRVFLARALVQSAELFFMDEPFAGVDAATEASIVKILRELSSKNKTVVVVHHHLPTVPEYFTHVMLLNNRLVASGSVEKTFTDENLRRTYGGKLTLLEDLSESLWRSERGEPRGR